MIGVDEAVRSVSKWRAAVAAYGPELTDAPDAFRDLAATYEMARAALGQQQPATPDQAFAAYLRGEPVEVVNRMIRESQAKPNNPD